MKYLCIFLISLQAHAGTILSGYGISMTRSHMKTDERLIDLKKFKTSFCIGFFSNRTAGAADHLVLFVQRKLKADFIRDFTLSEEIKHPFKTCYTLEGIASRVIKKGK
jgi:hypothetical protein